MHANIDALLKVRNCFKFMVSKNELKFIKSLKIKKYRTREKRFLVEGAKNVLELIKSDFSVDIILATQSYLEKNALFRTQSRVEVVTEKELSGVGSLVSNNECLAVAATRRYERADIDFSGHVFMLDGVNDPGNLGTIIRTLDWFGYNQLVCSLDTTELYNPKVISSTMGSFTRVKVWYEDLKSILKERPQNIYGAEMQGTRIFDLKPQTPGIIIMGSESNGISQPIQDLMTHSISIPKYGDAESLNVGIATGIIASYLRNS